MRVMHTRDIYGALRDVHDIIRESWFINSCHLIEMEGTKFGKIFVFEIEIILRLGTIRRLKRVNVVLSKVNNVFRFARETTSV